MEGKNGEELLALLGNGMSTEELISAMLNGQVSAAITAERVKRKMNQSEFAGLLGAKQSQVSKWESGDYNFTLNKIASIASILDILPVLTFQEVTPKATSRFSYSSKVVNFTSAKSSKEEKYMPMFSKSAKSELMEG